MKIAILFTSFFYLSVSTTAYSQLTVDDAKGKSSIAMKQSQIGFDVAATAVNASFNNYKKRKIEKLNSVFWGVDLRGELTEGLSNLISGGYTTTGSRLSGFLGWRHSGSAYEAKLATEIEKWADTIASLKKLPDTDEKKRKLREAMDAFDKASEALASERANHPHKEWLVYISPGLNANTFRRYDSTAPGNLKERYPKEKFRGGGVQMGVNYITGPHIAWGISAGIEQANTIDSLEDRESIVRTTTAAGNQTIIDDKKYTVKDGTYTEYNRFNLRTDLLYFSELKDTEYKLVWNVFYTRWYHALTVKEVVKDVFQLGTGINFFKDDGKLAGGVYLQSSDLFNNISQEDNFLKRIDFGLTVKLTFSSIFRPQ